MAGLPGQRSLGKRGLLLPVRIGEVDPPGLLQTRIHVDLVALGASAASICARYLHVTPHPVHSDKPTSKPLTLQASQDGPAVGGCGTTDERRHRWRRRANWRRAPMRTVSAPSSIGAADHIPRPGMSRAPHMGADAQRRCRPSEAGKAIAIPRCSLASAWVGAEPTAHAAANCSYRHGWGPVTISGRCRCRTFPAGRRLGACEAVRRACEALGQGGLGPAGGLRRQPGRPGCAVGRQRQLPPGAAGRHPGAAAGVHGVHGGGRLDRGPPTGQRHRLALHGQRPAGGHRRAGRGICRLCLSDPAWLAARRDRRGLVRLMDVVPDHPPRIPVPAVSLPHRPTAVAPLAARRLAGRSGGGGSLSAGRPPARAGRRRSGGRQPDRGRRTGGPGGERGRYRPARPAAAVGGGGVRVAGDPVSAVAGRGAPAAQVVHLRGRAGAAGGAGRRPTRRVPTWSSRP
jgi:hypothetical protein